ncbi:MAG: ABC transporter permease [Syntrophales bacterium]|jgi:peptide/nickel transport system permease protein|nr:ABC transporter permease [Syntrophales bacterium]MDY0045286.1 ABC transporter permease [Syntrophales bacterium]
MANYILKRLWQALICLIGISVIIFFLSHLSGDPVLLMASPEATQEDIEELRRTLGLDKPLYVQYWVFISGVVQGDFGQSIKWSKPCIDVWLSRFPNTLLLGSAAMAFSLIVGILTGVLSAVKVGGWFDKFGKIFALMGQSLPVFWVGLMLILIFSVNLGWLPTSGHGSWKHLIMPAFTLGWYFTAATTRLSRSAMLDVLDSEYIKMARVKGLPEYLVIMKHAFRNALIPIITLAALNLIMLLNGTVITEVVFNWEGIGRLVVDAIFARDYPLVQCCVLIASMLFIATNLFVDILYAYIDPRIHYH